jgi:hypothetical protein
MNEKVSKSKKIFSWVNLKVSTEYLGVSTEYLNVSTEYLCRYSRISQRIILEENIFIVESQRINGISPSIIDE